MYEYREYSLLVTAVRVCNLYNTGGGKQLNYLAFVLANFSNPLVRADGWRRLSQG